MSDRVGERQRVVWESLAARAAHIESRGGGRRRLALRGDAAPAIVVDARFDDDWLHLSAPLALDRFGAPMELLRRNAELAGGVKFARVGPAGACALELRAEVALDHEPALTCRRTDQAWAGFESALSVVASGGGPAPGSRAPEAPDLRALLAESGWPASARADGSLTVDLGVPDAFFQAEIDGHGGATWFTVALAAVEDAAAICREGLALLLLRAAAVVRMARPVCGSDGLPRFEVVLAGAPTATEVGHALSALAVGCRLFGREADVVQRSPALAARYCAAHGSTEARMIGTG